MSCGVLFSLPLLLLILACPINASPFSGSNQTNDTTAYVGYVSDPNGRGTSSLILSCLLTLILCVWSALHLNVPPPGETNSQYMWTCIRWITAGIYAPELVVFTAWRQWSSSRLLLKAVQEAIKQYDVPRNFDWTWTHSFFASTGGFAVDISPAGNEIEGYLPDSAPKRLTLTANGVALLAKLGHLPDVSVKEIEDKSKANDIAKFLVIVQAAWMLLQVLGRLITKLPVTLLEVNTVAHVLCAFSMYAMWWRKPLMPNEPIAISDQGLQDLVSFMFMSSEMSGYVDPKHRESQTVVKTLFASINLYSLTPELDQLCLEKLHTEHSNNNLDSIPALKVSRASTAPLNANSKRQSFIPPSLRHSKVIISSGTSYHIRAASAECLAQQLKERDQANSGTAFFERKPRIKVDEKHDVTRTQRKVHRWGLASEALVKYADQLRHDIYDHKTSAGVCSHVLGREYVVPYASNWPNDELLRNVNGLIVGMILWLANFLYGGIHLAAWNDHFPSTAEKWLWRSSASYIGFCGGLWVVLNYVVKSSSRLNEFWERWMDGEKAWWHNVLLGSLVFFCGLSLCFARAYIVVEAFISIRELPAAAYQTPDWTQVFPHF